MPVVIPYWGGKVKLSKQLVPLIPPHKHYFEVFAGGLSMFFRKQKAEWNCVNDITSDLINLYLVLSNPVLYEQFEQKVYWLPKNREYYSQIRDSIRRKEFNVTMPDVQRAFDYYYFIRNSFNSRLDTAFSRDITGWSTKLIDSLRFAREKLNGVIIENLDYKELVKSYYDKRNSFWYFDPPYVVADTEEYYFQNFTTEEHLKLKGCIDFLNTRLLKIFLISWQKKKSPKRRFLKNLIS
ncbi:MAG: DNA adenine methylase [Gammaproteobacteria bacterium]|nr:DNA adenine methylase [Gammaproteobacteria bacterium]